ncbi:MAG: sensor histidine kinase [Vicinamibacterales bacterium]
MKWPRSLRRSLLTGAALWTLGLLAITSVVLTRVVVSHPGAPFVFHGIFQATLHRTLVWGVFSAACLLGGLVLVRRGVSPVNRLRARLADVHAGRTRRLDGDYPAEVAPLVDDLNGLLADREARVARALARTGDLAHGLKTPLAVLAQAAERAAAGGDADQAAVIMQQVDRMRRQVDRHLALARTGVSGATPGLRCLVKPSVDALVRTLERLHADRQLSFAVAVDEGLEVRARVEDLDELLGNLLDNACRHARAHVAIGARCDGAAVELTVDDDGQGLDPSLWERVLQRGVRADEAAPGTGFGLAIVRELAELHEGGIALSRAPMGGLRATLRLPSA